VGIDLDRIEAKFNANQTVNPKELFNKDLIKSHMDTVKILGEGKLTKALIFEKVLVTASAKEKIAKAGGKITEAIVAKDETAKE
jgi:large subunit ribosomal protein L15